MIIKYIKGKKKITLDLFSLFISTQPSSPRLLSVYSIRQGFYVNMTLIQSHYIRITTKSSRNPESMHSYLCGFLTFLLTVIFPTTTIILSSVTTLLFVPVWRINTGYIYHHPHQNSEIYLTIDHMRRTLRCDAIISRHLIGQQSLNVPRLELSRFNDEGFKYGRTRGTGKRDWEVTK